MEVSEVCNPGLRDVASVGKWRQGERRCGPHHEGQSLQAPPHLAQNGALVGTRDLTFKGGTISKERSEGRYKELRSMVLRNWRTVSTSSPINRESRTGIARSLFREGPVQS